MISLAEKSAIAMEEIVKAIAIATHRTIPNPPADATATAALAAAIAAAVAGPISTLKWPNCTHA